MCKGRNNLKLIKISLTCGKPWHIKDADISHDFTILSVMDIGGLTCTEAAKLQCGLQPAL